MNGRDRIADVKSLGIPAVARAFEYQVTSKLGVTPCPACGATVRQHRTARRNAPPVDVRPDGVVFVCRECDTGGSAFDFAALAVLGHRAQRHEFGAVLRGCASRGLCAPLEGEPATTVCRTAPRRTPPILASPELPPAHEVAALWESCEPLRELDRSHAARAYLEARGFSSERLAWAGDLARVMAPNATMPTWWPSTWCSTWPVVVPAFNWAGSLVTLHARAVTKHADPKTRWPRGCSASGVLFADGTGRDFLRAKGDVAALGGLEAVVVVEGATDTLKVAQVLERSPVTWGVLGYTSGSKQAVERIAWPASIPCVVAVDDDDAGDTYAVELRRALPGVRMYRVRPPVPRQPDGKKGADWTDLADEVVRDSLGNVAGWEVLRD